MARTNPPAAPTAPQVRIRFEPTGGDGTGPYQGPRFATCPADAVPEGAIVLGSVEAEPSAAPVDALPDSEPASPPLAPSDPASP